FLAAVAADRLFIGVHLRPVSRMQRLAALRAPRIAFGNELDGQVFHRCRPCQMSQRFTSALVWLPLSTRKQIGRKAAASDRGRAENGLSLTASVRPALLRKSCRGHDLGSWQPPRQCSEAAPYRQTVARKPAV